MWFIILYLIAIVLVTVYIITLIRQGGAGIQEYVKGPVPLDKATVAIPSDVSKGVLQGQGQSTFSVLLQAQLGDRTAKLVGETRNTDATLIALEGVWSLDIGPSGAKMVVQTQSASGVEREEFVVPPLPLQKWTYLSILRDGRRFDVVYNGRIVASHRLAYYPLIRTSPVKIGGAGILGTAMHIGAAGTRLDPSALQAIYASLVDMSGNPRAPYSLLPADAAALPAIGVGTSTVVTAPPPDHLYQWASPYA